MDATHVLCTDVQNAQAQEVSVSWLHTCCSAYLRNAAPATRRQHVATMGHILCQTLSRLYHFVLWLILFIVKLQHNIEYTNYGQSMTME